MGQTGLLWVRPGTHGSDPSTRGLHLVLPPKRRETLGGPDGTPGTRPRVEIGLKTVVFTVPVR